MEAKWCPKCEKIRNYNEFYKNRSRFRGISAWCKSCTDKSHLKYMHNTKGIKERPNSKLINKDWLIDKYLIEKLSQRDIAKEAKCDRNIVRKSMKKYRIESRPVGEINENKTVDELRSAIIYREEVCRITELNYRKFKYIINPYRVSRGNKKYHIDHIYTIIDGFKNNVLPEVIASPINLQMLSMQENKSKFTRSDISLSLLYGLYNQFIIEIRNDNKCLLDQKNKELG